jgi:virginiamycin B lyase
MLLISRSAFVQLPIVLGTLAVSPVVEGALAPFVRGDFNQDGGVDVSDPIAILVYLFVEDSRTTCLSAADFSDDGTIDVSDAVSILGYLFQLGDPPAAPFPGCGGDPTPDSLGCSQHSPCSEGDVAPQISEWVVPWSSSRPRDPYVDGLGRVWFVGQTGNYVAFLEPESSKFTRFELAAGAAPHNLIVGDYVWYAGNGDAHIGKLDPGTGKVTPFPMPDPAAADPHTLAFDGNGDIWFTVQQGNFAGKLATGTGEIRLIPVPTSGASPYGIAVDSKNVPWFVEFGTNKIASIDTGAFSIHEFTLTRAGARPRRLGVSSDDSIWYMDHAQGYLGRFIPATEEIQEWPVPGGSSARPYAMAVDHRDRVWFVETGSSPNRFVGFNPVTEKFFGIAPIPSGGGTVRHMYFHHKSREIWFGTDTNTIGQARL